MVGLFDSYDDLISSELGVDVQTYTDVINNKCSYWEGLYIISIIVIGDERRMEKAKRLFNSKLCN